MKIKITCKDNETAAEIFTSLTLPEGNHKIRNKRFTLDIKNNTKALAVLIVLTIGMQDDHGDNKAINFIRIN